MSDQTPGDAQQGGEEARRGGSRRWLVILSLVFVIGALAIGGTVAAESGDSTIGGGLRDSFLTRLASKLGIEREQLNQAIATAGNETLDEAVANGELTQNQADALKKRVTDGRFFDFGPRHGRVSWGLFGRGDGMDTIATTLGITSDELRSELESGSTLQEVITAHGSTVETVVNALVTDAKVDLDAAVANGRITQSQADQILTNLPDRLTNAIENGFRCDPRGGGHQHNPDDTSTEATPTL